MLRSPKGKQDDERSHAENDSGERDDFDSGKRAWVICHVPSSAAVERQP